MSEVAKDKQMEISGFGVFKEKVEKSIGRSIEGRTESIYLGKNLDFKKARRKIARKEKELNIFF